MATPSRTLWRISAAVMLFASAHSHANTQRPAGTPTPPALQAAEVTNERLVILRGEREQINAALLKASADTAPDAASRKARLIDDLKAIDSEIARVAKQPAYALRNNGEQAGAGRHESRKASATTSISNGTAHLFGAAATTDDANTKESPFVFSLQAPRQR